MNKKYNHEPDIPVAVATDVSGAPLAYAEAQLVTGSRTTLQKGRSSRVVVTEQAPKEVLTDFELHTLKSQGYTSGLIAAVIKNSQTFPLRIWVVDNSGSMSMGDGHRIVETHKKENVKLVQCSRWTEIQETVDYHAQMAALLQTPTVFRLLNDPGKMVGPQQFGIAERGPDMIAQDLQVAQTTMKGATPSGCTPLAEHVREIRENIMAIHEQLREKGQKVAIILATDGLPTDPYGVSSKSTRAEFEMALRSLEGLPVWIVVRLCTDEDNVVEYYNNLDAQLELSLEVLDDFVGEAHEVYEHNPWLTYSLCLHRIREVGFNHRLFDLLDERRLTVDELREFLYLLFGEEHFDGVPDPQMDWKGFLAQVSIIVYQENRQWNPISKKLTPWVDMKKLKNVYSDGACSIM